MDTRRAGGGPDLGRRPRLSVVMPVYNEGELVVPTIRGLEAAIAGIDHEVLVVHDMDEDTTVPVVKQLGAELPAVRAHRNRLGRGVLKAMLAGFEGSRGPYVLVMMADGSDEPRDIPRMLELAEAGADVVSAARYARGGRQLGGPLVKRTLSRAAGLSLHWLGGVPTHDATNNFKLYSRRLLDAVRVESVAGFELALELTVKAHLLGMRVAEVPTTWRDRTGGQSRFQLRKWLPNYLHWYRLGMAARFGFRPGPAAGQPSE